MGRLISHQIDACELTVALSISSSPGSNLKGSLLTVVRPSISTETKTSQLSDHKKAGTAATGNRKFQQGSLFRRERIGTLYWAESESKNLP